MSHHVLPVFSHLLLTIYRAAQELPVAQFQDAVLEALKACLPFDSSMWGQGVMKQAGIDIHSIHLHNTGPEMLIAYDKVKDQDDAAVQITQQPRSTLAFKAKTVFGRPEQTGIREFCSDFGHENFFITCDINPLTKFGQWISLYRKDALQFGTEEEVQILDNIAPHLMQALAINRTIHLQKMLGDVAREKWAVAIADARGYLYHADPQFKTLVRAEWKHSTDELIDRNLLKSLRTHHNRVVGQRVVVQCRIEHGLLYLKARQRERVDSLTPRELEVAKLLLSGLTRKEVASKSNRTAATIQSQTRSIYNKLGIQNAVLLAQHLALAE